jgi:hypothetical protein
MTCKHLLVICEQEQINHYLVFKECVATVKKSKKKHAQANIMGHVTTYHLLGFFSLTTLRQTVAFTLQFLFKATQSLFVKLEVQY